MNVIHRSNFEARLNAHLDSGDNDTETDPAWYALRNTVYAFGARTTTNRDSQTNGWAEAQLHGWKYFQNAFSVHSDLVYSWSSVPAVQAVFCMVCIMSPYITLLKCLITGNICGGHRGSKA